MEKKRAIIALVLLVCSLGVCFGAANWRQVSSPTSNNLRAVAAYNGYQYWAVGDNGIVVNGGNGYSNEVSTSISGIEEYNLMDVAVSKSNGQNIYIVGEKKADPNKYQGIIIKTPDGGTTWVKVITGLSLPASTPFKSVSISNDGKIVYISGGNGVIICTNNYGVDWQKLKAPQLSGLTNSTDADYSFWRKIDCDPAAPTDVWTINEDFGVAGHSTDGGANSSLAFK
jgi:photosystem II stability/assembly factor-like uncharacterized protein